MPTDLNGTTAIATMTNVMKHLAADHDNDHLDVLMALREATRQTTDLTLLLQTAAILLTSGLVTVDPTWAAEITNLCDDIRTATGITISRTTNGETP